MGRKNRVIFVLLTIYKFFPKRCCFSQTNIPNKKKKYIKQIFVFFIKRYGTYNNT